MKRHDCVLPGIILLFLICSCAALQKQTEDAPENREAAGPEKSMVVHSEEEEKSLEIFTQVLEIVESADNRRSVLPQVEGLYVKIIEEYPGAPLAQESYWKLVSIYLNDYDPPEYEKAEAKYHEFRSKYPDSVLKDIISTTLADNYYRNTEWNKLLELCNLLSGDQQDKESMPNASLLFKCAEADYNLGNTNRAIKNYRTLADMYPDSGIAKKAGMMVEQIEKQEDK